MANAKNDGVYTLDGARFLIKKGETLPDGAVMDAVPETTEAASAPEVDTAKAAAEKAKADTDAKAAADKAKADAKAAVTGPSETTEAAPAPEQA